MSPRWRGAPRGGADSPDGNDSTLVGRFLPRQRRLSVRTAASSVSTTLRAARPLALLAAAAMARRTVLRALGTARQRDDSTRMSTIGPGAAARDGRPRFVACSFRAIAVPLGCVASRRVVGQHDAGNQLVADHVLGLEGDVADAVDVGEESHGLRETGGLAVRQVDLARIA